MCSQFAPGPPCRQSSGARPSSRSASIERYHVCPIENGMRPSATAPSSHKSYGTLTGALRPDHRRLTSAAEYSSDPGQGVGDMRKHLVYLAHVAVAVLTAGTSTTLPASGS